MIKLENTITPAAEQWMTVIMGARNPKNSWEKSDSVIKNQILKDEEVAPGVTRTYWSNCTPYISIGPKDLELVMKLRNAGTDHRKYLRMLPVYVDITAPLYWWKEFDTYKVGTVANSCSTMHKIHEKEFTLEDFSTDIIASMDSPFYLNVLLAVIEGLNTARESYLVLKDGKTQFDAVDAKEQWRAMIELLPSSYNQKRTVMLNYEVLANMYKSRKNHKLDEWVEFCKWIESLPYSELISGGFAQKTSDALRELSKKMSDDHNKPDFTNHDGAHDYD
jgi:hypothetical protein